MDFSLTGSFLFLPAVIIGVIVVAIIAIVIYQSRSKKSGSFAGSPENKTLHQARNRLDYQPGTKPVPGFIRPAGISAPAKGTPEIPKPRDIDLTSSCRDMTESLTALTEKYSLTSFTIATQDGLVFGSSGGDTPQSDAAIFSEIFKNDPLNETPGVILFRLTHKGSELIGIIRTKPSLPKELLQQIAGDAKNILNVWV